MSTSTPIQFPAQIDGVSKKKDGTLTVKIGTQEMSPEDTAKIFEFGNQLAWIAMSDTDIKRSDIQIPEFVPEFDGEKSPSQRLRAVLHVLWDKRTDHSKSSDQFYRDYMEKLINNAKEKID